MHACIHTRIHTYIQTQGQPHVDDDGKKRIIVNEMGEKRRDQKQLRNKIQRNLIKRTKYIFEKKIIFKTIDRGRIQIHSSKTRITRLLAP